MNLPAAEQLEALSRTELLGLVRELLLLVTQQQTDIAQLKAELAQLKQPPPTSRNSSQSPARDQKVPLNKPPKKKHGPPFGQMRHLRPLVDNPDRVIPRDSPWFVVSLVTVPCFRQPQIVLNEQPVPVRSRMYSIN
jgi:hypothetical protein